jgi:hypothetical protein
MPTPAIIASTSTLTVLPYLDAASRVAAGDSLDMLVGEIESVEATVTVGASPQWPGLKGSCRLQLPAYEVVVGLMSRRVRACGAESFWLAACNIEALPAGRPRCR